MTINEAKHDLARRSRRGITNIGAGVLLWTTFGVLGMVLPPSPQRALIYLFGAGMLLPTPHCPWRAAGWQSATHLRKLLCVWCGRADNG